ncbi:MAG: thymidine phosphorylase [Rhodospirillaceae bacterium]|nr:thymidine phosphorylase [Rhodospirillaceae bacterium]
MRGVYPNHTGAAANTLLARRLGIDTKEELVAFMRADCNVCRSEGLTSRARVRLTHDGRTAIATLYHLTSGLLAPGEVGLSEATWQALEAEDGATVAIAHPAPVTSLSHVRGKVYGHRLTRTTLPPILRDIVTGRYSDVQLSAFVTACAARPLDHDEIVALTHAMVDVGDRLSWDTQPIADKHCVGGLPGNRTTPIVVSIIAACGLVMPKTSSRAITSPAGTADTMEVLTRVDLSVSEMRRVVEREGGCIVWGGAVQMSPADDIMIRVERALDLDSEGQLIASVLSKKIAAGATHLVLDIPVGPTAKVRNEETARFLERSLLDVAKASGIEARTVWTDGTQPVGRGIGPALEARGVMAVLKNEPDAAPDLRSRSIALAGALLELTGAAAPGQGETMASAVVDDGRAWAKFQRICEAQGGMRVPPVAAYVLPVTAGHAGRVVSIDNRRLAMVAKLAGAPDAKAAGVELHVRLAAEVTKGEPLFTVHAETRGELAYAMEYVMPNVDIIGIAPA